MSSMQGLWFSVMCVVPSILGFGFWVQDSGANIYCSVFRVQGVVVRGLVLPGKVEHILPEGRGRQSLHAYRRPSPAPS